MPKGPKASALRRGLHGSRVERGGNRGANSSRCPESHSELFWPLPQADRATSWPETIDFSSELISRGRQG